MALTRISRGMLANGAVVVPDNLYTPTTTATSNTFLAGNGTWKVVDSVNTQSNYTVSNLTVTNSISAGSITVGGIGGSGLTISSTATFNGTTNIANAVITTATISNLSGINNLTVTNARVNGTLTFNDNSTITSANTLRVTWDRVDDKSGANGPSSVALGRNSFIFAGSGILLGNNTGIYDDEAIVIGNNAEGWTNAINIGNYASYMAQPNTNGIILNATGSPQSGIPGGLVINPIKQTQTSGYQNFPDKGARFFKTLMWNTSTKEVTWITPTDLPLPGSSYDFGTILAPSAIELDLGPI